MVRRNVSQHTMHYTLMHMGLCSHRSVRLPMLIYCKSTIKGIYNGHVTSGTGPWSNGRSSLGLITWTVRYVFTIYLWE